MQSVFKTYHPGTIFLYCIAVIALTFSSREPVLLGISFACASVYFCFLKGVFPYFKTLIGFLPFFVIIVAINAMFVSSGLTVIFILFGHTVTFEALLYGLACAIMLLNALLWFSCMNELIGTEELLFLFSRALPTTALMIVITFASVPKLLRRGRSIHDAQLALLGTSASKRMQLKQALRTFTALMGLVMEDGIESADALLIKKYGKARRTAYSNWRWSMKDTVVLVVIVLLSAVSIYVFVTSNFAYYPTLSAFVFRPGYCLYAILLLFPLLLEFRGFKS